VGTSTPTEYVREWTEPVEAHRMQVYAPSDGEWRYTLREWR
jgi:hypothetical protein